MDQTTPEAFLEGFIEWNGDTHDSMIARSILYYVRELGTDGFDEYIDRLQADLYTAEQLKEQFERERD
jgi:hypothetical protein